MTSHRLVTRLALSLGLFLSLPEGSAQAAFIRRALLKSKTDVSTNMTTYRVVGVVPEDGTTTVASVTAELSSDAGDDALVLTETNAWLHGSAQLGALPTTDAGLTLSLYATGSASLISLSGTLGADGSVTLTADNSCTTKEGCAVVDIEVSGAEVFAWDSGFDLTFDLLGADTYSVAYAQVDITASSGAQVCLATDKSGACVEWGGSEISTTTAELDFDAIGSVWEAELATEPEGAVEIEWETLDSRGKKLDRDKGLVGLPWRDAGGSISTLAVDEDPLTTLGLTGGTLTVLSEGWTMGDSLPTQAEVELSGGQTLTMPANSYQRRGRGRVFEGSGFEGSGFEGSGFEGSGFEGSGFEGSGFEASGFEGSGFEGSGFEGSGFEGSGRDYSGLFPDLKISSATGSQVWSGLSLQQLATPVCADGLCVVLTSDAEGSLDLSLTSYSWDPARLDDSFTVGLRLLDKEGKELDAEELVVDLDDEVIVVFSNEIEPVGDPTGSILSGEVQLLGEASAKGKQKTLSKGRFVGSVARDIDGEVGCALIDDAQSAGKVGAESINVSVGAALSVGGEGPGFTAVPPLAAICGNGKGTKNSSSSASTKPELL